MWKTRKNQPMDKKTAFNRFREYGYEPIDATYINNRTKINCKDSEGYIVKVTLDSLGRLQTYQRFSTTCNEENFLHNTRLYAEKNNFDSKVLYWETSSIKNHINVKCLCSCGKEFIVDFNDWQGGRKTRCNSCTAKLSNIEKEVKEYLESKDVAFQSQKRFDGCKDKRVLPFDFYIPSLNLCIEVDGEQHFYSSILHTKENAFETLKKHDQMKTDYCKGNNIELLRLDFREVRSGKYKTIIDEKINIC